MYSTALSTVGVKMVLAISCPAPRPVILGQWQKGGGGCLPEWMASASLSGISMLNSCVVYTCQRTLRPKAKFCLSKGLPYLLNGHHNLNSVQAVQAEVVGKVRGGLDLQGNQEMMSVAELRHSGRDYPLSRAGVGYPGETYVAGVVDL